VLSLEGGDNYRGRSRGVMVHRLPPVDRDAVILPERTLQLLNRNVMELVGSRPAPAKPTRYATSRQTCPVTPP
jgi:hypothetical protein